jgi:hypothetical protein
VPLSKLPASTLIVEHITNFVVASEHRPTKYVTSETRCGRLAVLPSHLLKAFARKKVSHRSAWWPNVPVMAKHFSACCHVRMLLYGSVLKSEPVVGMATVGFVFCILTCTGL